MAVNPIRVMLVDDEPLIRAGIAAILSAEGDLEIVAEASDGVDVVALAEEHRPDVILMDVRMPKIDGIDATRNVRQRMAKPPRILVLTTFESDDYVYQALKAGADGFLLKREHPRQIAQAVRTVALSESLLFPEALRKLAVSQLPGRRGDGLAGRGLSEREKDVLRRLAQGMTNAEIAQDLFLGTETVKTHVGNILLKIEARDRTQAVIAAYESGFIPVE
ncbi:response regulator transcription factor [Saxibacter everestensis]|uniref:Response regulator transcription factor n=1 Tax=Saxibacter everestensis TaxID=2909229 RepID=A0ABY8QUU2_9MICO|nr:response regulator transcription factor [Brevibacteriaceae bacterium ZFBP1038]